MLMLTAIRYAYNCGLPEVQGSCVTEKQRSIMHQVSNFAKLHDLSNAGVFN